MSAVSDWTERVFSNVKQIRRLRDENERLRAENKALRLVCRIIVRAETYFSGKSGVRWSYIGASGWYDDCDEAIDAALRFIGKKKKP
jgi:hypothetical protein